MKELKKFQNRAFTIGATGIGLSLMAGISPDANTSAAIGKMGKGLGTLSSLSVMDASMGLLSKYTRRR